MFNPSELEGEVDHSFFDSDCAESSTDAEHKVKKGLKAEKKISKAHDKLHAKHRENYRGDLSSRSDQTRKHLKQAETYNRSSRSSVSTTSDKISNESSDSEDCANLEPKRSSRTFMALLAEAKEVDNTDVYIQSPKETKGEALPFSASSKRRNKQSPKKVIRNLHNQSPSAPPSRSESPSLSSTETSTDADSEGSYSSSSHQSSLESPALPKTSATSSSCPGIRRTRVGSARPRDFPVLHTADSDDSVTDVTPLSSPDTSPLQSLDLNVTEVEEESHKEEQPQQSVPSSGLRNIQDDDSDQDVDECSLNLESQLGRKLVFHYPGGRNRKNYSFSNEEVRRIDLENQRLLRELSRLSPGPRSGSAPVKKSHGASNSPRIRLTHSAVNRQREQQRIERENLAFLKRLESVKPTPGLRRSEQLADYQRQAGYLGGSSFPICRSTTKKDRSSSRTTSAGPRSVNSRASLPSTDSSSRPSPRSKKTGAARAAWC
ncbi:cilia- and flagella-associated protein 97 isoform X1 [Pundamilia nyererei]|uniref:Cilia- and flagella-associated protein 97 n=1 Tax=Pundamilia nyererei TaxID=303518 RepID=A0A9Y3QR87_9CICH|nr:PREDICTED: cilia- and flagella-associated protein 97 isoform X1 [Pundamilia nyererei]